MSGASLQVRPRECVASGSAYRAAPQADAVRVDLAGNEGRGPNARWVQERMERWASEVRRYPDPSELGGILADRFGVSPDRVVLTPGADDALDRICRVVLEPGRSLLLPGPTFEMIERYGALAGATVRHLDWIGNLETNDVLEAADETTAMVALVTPNNPTGSEISRTVIRKVAESLPSCLVLADLAYIEFADEDPTAELATLPNVVITRTLSKAYGLAGLRVGAAIAHPTVASWLRAAAGPYGVSGPSLAIAADWLRDSEGEVEEYIRRVRSERDTLSTELRELGWSPLPSGANFVTLDTPLAVPLGAALLERGVRVRTWPTDPARSRFARISCPGDRHELDVLVAALREIGAPSELKRSAE